MEKFSRTSVFFPINEILCENFSKIGPIIEKIPKFSDDPLNCASYLKMSQFNYYSPFNWRLSLMKDHSKVWNKPKFSILHITLDWLKNIFHLLKQDLTYIPC